MKKTTKNLSKNIASFFIILLIVVTVFSFIASDSVNNKEKIGLSQLVEMINNNEVEEIVVIGNKLEILKKDETTVVSQRESDTSLSQSLKELGVEGENLQTVRLEFQEERDWSFLFTAMLLLLPLFIILFLFRSIFRQAKGGAMQAMDFSKAKARLFGEGGIPSEKITFEDVAGLKEAKEELKEIVEFLKEPARFLKIGARIPKGVLLTGAPGTGKTLLARAVSGEAKVPFFEISGSEFIELFVGVGSGRVRDLFNTAKKKQPCIVYIDELDAVGRARGAGVGGGNDEREQTLNQILVEMDGFSQDTKIIVLASTNRPDILDPALLRPGRFDRKIVLDVPDKKSRIEVLKIHSKNKPLEKNVDFNEIAERTSGFSGADLANLANEAAIYAARQKKTKVDQSDFLESIEKVLLGPERRSYAMSKKEKEITAYHEAGHAIVSSFLPNTDPVRKISIIARGQAAGYTLKVASEESYIKRRSDIVSEMAVLLGGYCAEKIVFKEVSTGAVNDLERASRFARKLVKEFGMSLLGPVHFGGEKEHMFLGREVQEERKYSEETAAKIDKEVSNFIKRAEQTAMKKLKEKKEMLDKVANILIEKETLERKEYEKIIKG
mgnify:CR=1 FL=1